MPPRPLAGLLVASAALAIDLRIEPGRERIRPLESAAILLRGVGTAEGAVLRVAEAGGGWLSRPFRWTEPDTVAALYTAPGRPGRYVIEARYRAARLDVEIEVTTSARSSRLPESISFGPESDARDFYRDLAEHYAPLVCQETWFDPKADYLARFDYDGDWRGDNNGDRLAQGSSQAYVYYTAMETSTHYFLIYSFFHPRRYSDQCTAQTCHENDNEGLILTIRKDGSKHGRLQVMETRGADAIHTYTADSRLREGSRRLSGEVRLWRDSHPMVFIEAGRHGVASAADAARSRFSVDRMEFAGTGVTYRYGGTGARPAHPSDREVSYQLLPIREHWWTRAAAGEGRPAGVFDEYFRYTPLGNRPGAAAEQLAGAFRGRQDGANRARPFWAWPEPGGSGRRLLAAGQWGLDPAYAVSVSVRFPPSLPFSLDYIFNPYLEGAGRRDAITAIPVSQAERGDQTRTPAGQRHLLSAPAEKPRYDLTGKNGQLEFRGRVDGSLYLHIHLDQIEVEYLSGRPMDEIRYRFSQPLPAVEMEEVRLENVDGRGSVRLLEWPNTGNGFTAKVRIQDDKGGAGLYHFKLQWKRR